MTGTLETGEHLSSNGSIHYSVIDWEDSSQPPPDRPGTSALRVLILELERRGGLRGYLEPVNCELFGLRRQAHQKWRRTVTLSLSIRYQTMGSSDGRGSFQRQASRHSITANNILRARSSHGVLFFVSQCSEIKLKSYHQA